MTAETASRQETRRSRGTSDDGVKIVKSAKRVLEVLEYFDENHRAATVMDIARTFDYPQSSASEILRCLVAIGYLTYDRYTRTFSPTIRVAVLGSWVMPDLFRQSRLLAAVDRVASETGCEVTISAALNYLVYHVHRAGRGSGQPETCSLLHSPQGRMLLATYTERTVMGAIHRLNAAEPDAAQRVRPAQFMDDVRKIKSRGWDSGEDGAGPPVVAVPVPFAKEERLVLSVRTQMAPEIAHARLCEIFGTPARSAAQRQSGLAGHGPATAVPARRYSAA